MKRRQSQYKCYKWRSTVCNDDLRSVHSVYNEISHDVNQQENADLVKTRLNKQENKLKKEGV